MNYRRSEPKLVADLVRRGGLDEQVQPAQPFEIAKLADGRGIFSRLEALPGRHMASVGESTSSCSSSMVRDGCSRRMFHRNRRCVTDIARGRLVEGPGGYTHSGRFGDLAELAQGAVGGESVID